MTNTIYMQLNLNANEANRLYWNNQYFSVEGALVFNQQAQSEEEIKKTILNSILVLKLTPFKDSLRAKILAELSAEKNSPHESQILGLTVGINIAELKILEIQDIRQGHAILNNLGESQVNNNTSVQLKLTESENSELIAALQKLAIGNLAPHLREPFVCYFPQFTDESWKSRIPKNPGGGGKTTLTPFQAAFPFSGPIDRILDDNIFALDDLYCTNPTCDCREATCIILQFDKSSGKEIAFGGFKYNFEKKNFKYLPNFPSNFNAQEWFRQFSKNLPVNLSVTLQARYNFLRRK